MYPCKSDLEKDSRRIEDWGRIGLIRPEFSFFFFVFVFYMQLAKSQGTFALVDAFSFAPRNPF